MAGNNSHTFPDTGHVQSFLEPKRHSFGEPGVTYGQSPLSAMNGMETPLTLFLIACFTAPLIQRYRYQMEKYGKISDMSALFPLSACLLIGAIILSRLDDISYAGAIGLWILLSRGSAFSQRIKLCLRVFGPAAIMLGCYALYNYYSVGLIMPISASIKMQQTDTS